MKLLVLAVLAGVVCAVAARIHHKSTEKLHKIHHASAHNSCMPPLADRLNLPSSVDWRTEGYVTDVKNQGQCLDASFFAVTGSLEGQWFRKTGKLIPLSEQNLADCCGQGPSTCSGETCSFDQTYQYIKSKGLESLADYPDSGASQKCMFDPSKRVATCSGYTYVTPANDESALKEAVATVGPISVVIDASQASFQTYTSGVYNEPACSSTQLDHSVLVVGYGTDPTGGDYWIVKNSWGKDWGMNGYILMSRNKKNQCGIAASGSYPYFSC